MAKYNGTWAVLSNKTSVIDKRRRFHVIVFKVQMICLSDNANTSAGCQIGLLMETRPTLDSKPKHQSSDFLDP